MRKLFLFLTSFVAITANAQNYLINFTGNGAASTVETVKVENLTSGATLTLSGNDVLRLSGSVGIIQLQNSSSSAIKIFPNPMDESSRVEVCPPVSGDAIITIYETTGTIILEHQSYLENSKQEFELSGLKNGMYLINIMGNSYQYSGKLLCTGLGNGSVHFEKINNLGNPVGKVSSKKALNESMGTVDMPYTNGDRLKFTGKSGNYSTVKTDIPTQNKTLSFRFIACKDGDNNNYPIVEIGTQAWMGTNLKTTKFSNGISIPLVTESASWSELVTPGYSWYENAEGLNKNTYGALYNWYTVNSGTLCPANWHVPTYDEWLVLADYLGGEDFAGGKLKDIGVENWINPNINATNETGFTALPGGCLYYSQFDGVGSAGYWWNSSEYGTDNAWMYFMYSDGEGAYSYTDPKSSGYSVRCLEGSNPVIVLPTLNTLKVSSITMTNSTGGGDILSDGGALITERGLCYSTSVNPTIANNKTTSGTGTGSFTCSIEGLEAGTTYYLRAFATNSKGTSYGDEISFTTFPLGTTFKDFTSVIYYFHPTAGGSYPDNPYGGIRSSVKTLTFAQHGKAETNFAVWDTVLCWITINGDNSIGFEVSNTWPYEVKLGDPNDASRISHFDPVTGKIYLYYYYTGASGNRIFWEEFTPVPEYGSITDSDGNTYKTVTIGTQTWMAENLKTTKYNDNTDIQLVEDASSWGGLTTPSYCWYNNDEASIKSVYGALYNWYTVNTGKLCPTGWHVPTVAEWSALTDYLGDYTVAGGKLKEAGFTHWSSPNKSATNETGFTALPGGSRNSSEFVYIGFAGFWWSSSTNEYNNDYATPWLIYYSSSALNSSDALKQDGVSVRCLEDSETTTPTAAIKKASIAPVIDGLIDASWSEAISYKIDKNFIGETPTLGNKGTTTWKALWDYNGIYILLQVNDNVFVPAYAGINPSTDWMYDKPEIYFDVNSDLKDGLGSSNGLGHYQISPGFVQGKTDGTPVTAVDDVINAFLVTNQTYVAEYFIPFSKLLDKNGSFFNKAGSFGFDVTIIDGDVVDPIRNRAVWTNTGTVSESYINMDDCGTVTLEGLGDFVGVTGITIITDSEIYTIGTEGGTLQMYTEILPANASDQRVEWKVENGTGRAFISTDGLLTAQTDGTVTVTVRAKDGTDIFSSRVITISNQFVTMDDINIIKNGDFAQDGGLPVPWGFWSGNEGVEPFIKDGVAICSPLADADFAWQYQFNQIGLDALPNTDYIFSFIAWSDVERIINVDFEDTPENGYTRYGTSSDPESNGTSDWTFAVSTVPKRYTFHVNFDKMVATTVQKVQFMLAQTSDKIYIDGVSLISSADLEEIGISKMKIEIVPKPVVIDGVIDGSDPWSADKWVDVSMPGLDNTFGDMTAKFQMMYDETNLYFAVKVKDGDRFTGNATTYLNDCIEFFIDMDTTSGSGVYKTGTKQLRLQAVADPAAPGGLIECPQGNLPLGVYKVVDNGDNYVQEWKMPWAELTADMDPTWDQKQFKFDIQVANATSDGNRTQHAFWNNNSDLQWNNTTKFGLVTLRNPIANNTSVTDVEGNVYNTVTIGTQTWMAENLKTTKYNDGTDIPLVTDGAAWAALSTPGYCWYNNDKAANKATYGALYNWYTVNTGKLCPTDWHVPTDSEWTVLIDYLGGDDVAGGKLKETGTAHWNFPNIGATNETGFTGLPGGAINCIGIFSYFGEYGSWWSSNEEDNSNALRRDIGNNSSSVGRFGTSKQDGWSIRCLKN